MWNVPWWGFWPTATSLLEGVPGLAKTLLIETIGQAIQAGFSRIQFTPDLLPSDLIGTRIYNPRTGEFSVQKGPIFSNLVLTDEVNRALRTNHGGN